MNWWQSWNLHPLIVGTLAFASWRYMDMTWHLWARTRTGNGVRRSQVYAFWVSVIALFIALVSPLDALSEMLFSVHMIQHLVLILISPALFAYALPPQVMLWMIPTRWRRKLIRISHTNRLLQHSSQILNSPLIVGMMFAMTLWGWHIPSLYTAALVNPTLHIVEHASFVIVAYLFWLQILNQHQMVTTIGTRILLLFVTTLQITLLALMIMLSSTIWYPIYMSENLSRWGITALQDQQIGGLLMWLPGGLLFISMMLYLLHSWFQSMNQQYRVNE